MNKTKQKILITSLELFNNGGISNTSLRDIADEVGVSVGNLQYHFKKREDIIEAIYFQLVEKIDGVILINKDDLLKSFFLISTEMITLLFEYRFFLLDFISVTRNNNKIKNHYLELSKRREKEFLLIADVLIEKDIFRKELLHNEYHYLFKRIEIISNFWFSSILIQNDVLSHACLKEYALLIRQSIYPYLTKNGKRSYTVL